MDSANAELDARDSMTPHPDVADPDVACPDAAHPDVGHPDVGHTDGGHPDAAHAEATHPDSDYPDTASPGGEHPTSAEHPVPTEHSGSSVQPGYGVGPWPGGEAEWPTEPHYDPELLAAGDTRNVIDRYRYWRMEAIVADLDTQRHPFHVAIENWQHDMNIGSIVRSANAFLADTVHIIGRRRWNKRGAMVTDRYQHVVHHETVEAFAVWAADAGIPIVAVDNVDGAVPVDRAELPERCVLLFGQEGPGLSDEALAAASAHIEITQYGSTRSINASAAAAVIMYEWCRRYAGLASAGSDS